MFRLQPFLRHKSFSHSRRVFTNIAHESYKTLPGFHFWPNYFTREEQRILLLACLHKLDTLDIRQARRKRRDFRKLNPVRSTTSLLGMFTPDVLYEFEEACFVLNPIRMTYRLCAYTGTL